jgi:hypothetical protein
MWLSKRRRRRSSGDDSLIEFTIPGRGALVNDGGEVVKLRLAAAEVGGSSLQLSDRDGDLAIALSVPGTDPSEAAGVIDRLCRLADLPPPA